MVDPLAEVVSLLQPRARFSKSVAVSGPWRVRRTDDGHPFYGVVLEGTARASVEGEPPIDLVAGDFILMPAALRAVMSSVVPPGEAEADALPQQQPDGTFRFGDPSQPPDTRLLVGHCEFESPDAAVLVSLLPRLVHVRGEERLTTLVRLLGDESRAQRPAREVILERLLEVLLIEAMRSTGGTGASPGLMRGLADARLAAAIRRMHEQPSAPWTVVQLAKAAALSRSAFFERFSRAVGVAPMEYLLAWRMALAKHLLGQRDTSVADVAERVGYSSASTFSVAFSRHVGVSPGRYGRAVD